jgi:hypothetical protein
MPATATAAPTTKPPQPSPPLKRTETSKPRCEKSQRGFFVFERLAMQNKNSARDEEQLVVSSPKSVAPEILQASSAYQSSQLGQPKPNSKSSGEHPTSHNDEQGSFHIFAVHPDKTDLCRA